MLGTKYLWTMLIATAAWAGAKTAQEYFLKSADLYTDAAYPTAEIEAREGLAQYPSDKKLQMLLQRIQEAMKDQKDKNNQQNPGNSSQGQSSSSNSKDHGTSGGQQESSGGQSSSSQASKSPQNAGQGNSSQAQSSSSGAPKDSLQEGQLDKDQAEKLLKDFQQSDKDHKRKAQMNGRAVPEKDW